MECILCKVDKPEEFFIKLRGTGLSPRCDTCRQKIHKAVRAWQRNKGDQLGDYRSKYNRKYKYGLNPEDFDRLLDSQRGLCGICQTPISKPCIDHCHITGKVRGLLCYCCNTALGKFRESPELLQKALNYLKKDT